MKVKSLYFAVLGASILVSSCANPPMYPSRMMMPVVAATPAQMKMDGEIVEGIMVADKNEIAAATIAQKQASTDAVKRYATVMYNGHSYNLQETERLSRRAGIMPVQSNESRMMQQKGKQEIAKLSRLHGIQFDRAYIAGVIKCHTRALVMIDRSIAKAYNPMLKRQLEASRVHVAKHLEQAKMVQNEISHS